MGDNGMLVTAEGCDLEVERGPGWLFIRVRNIDPDCPGCSALADRVWAILQQHLTYRVVLEMDEVETLPRPLVAELVRLQRRIRDHDGVIRLSGVSPRGESRLRAQHLDDQILDVRRSRRRGNGNSRSAEIAAAAFREGAGYQPTSSSLAISWTPSRFRMASCAICFWK